MQRPQKWGWYSVDVELLMMRASMPFAALVS